MALLFRDPFYRDPFFCDPFFQDSISDRERLYPLTHHRQPVRVHREATSAPEQDLLPSLTPRAFDRALSQLQNVMDDVSAAIGEYESGAGRDLVAGAMRTTRTEDGNLQMAIDVSQYKPEEINMRLCDDNLVVEAKTESSENNSYHKSEFKRWLKLPADCKHDAIKSTLTPDMKLIVEVPVLKPIADSRSRTIPTDVQQKPAVESAPSQEGDKKQEGGKNE